MSLFPFVKGLSQYPQDVLQKYMNNNLQAQHSHALIYQTGAWLICMNHQLYLKAFIRKFEPRHYLPCGPSGSCPMKSFSQTSCAQIQPYVSDICSRVGKDSAWTEIDLAKSPTAFFNLTSLLVGRCSCSMDQPCPIGGTSGTAAHL